MKSTAVKIAWGAAGAAVLLIIASRVPAVRRMIGLG